MSYGVMASKSASVQLERTTPTEKRGYDRARERFLAPEATPWSAGRLTLTALHLSFMPNRPSPGVKALTLDLADIIAVEASPGRLNKTVSFRTTDLVLHARVTGAMAFAKRVAISVESSRGRRGADPGTSGSLKQSR